MRNQHYLLFFPSTAPSRALFYSYLFAIFNIMLQKLNEGIKQEIEEEGLSPIEESNIGEGN